MDGNKEGTIIMLSNFYEKRNGVTTPHGNICMFVLSTPIYRRRSQLVTE